MNGHPYSAAALGNRRLPSPSPIVPSTPIPRANLSHQAPYQRRPSASSIPNLSDAPNTRGLMKRLLAKPAPTSSSVVTIPTDRDEFQTNEDPGQEITIPRSSNSLPSPNEFEKSIRALDLIGQVDISMAPGTLQDREQAQTPSPPGSRKKQRNVLRRRPSGFTQTTASQVPISPSPGMPPFFAFPFT